MAKNLMPEIAKMLGVEIGEHFKVRKEDSEIYYFTDVAFLKQVNDAESEDYVGDLEEEDLLVLYYLLSGKETVVKLPWEPQEGDMYYILNTRALFIESFMWDNGTFDYLAKNMGIIYRTKAEAEEHLAEDYERLTGKKLEV